MPKSSNNSSTSRSKSYVTINLLEEVKSEAVGSLVQPPLPSALLSICASIADSLFAAISFKAALAPSRVTLLI